ncbi:hypothetical protein [uncultured Lacinutrix sp.]|uniref:toxin-antitoxin system YwqK family antitoxin n=1 Tax=uncultured Lacinutrix sp. TaxID=574032 RepID=UPI002602C265|nr:hypothetical protein [uncultured Lacinutrix sp.]
MLKSFSLLSFSFLTVLLSTLFSVNNDLQKKVIRDGDHDIECYVSLKKIKSFDSDKMYYWYKSAAVHHSMSSAGGYVLHSSFTKFYKSNQLAEQGNFNLGLKNGVWQTWYENGQLKERQEWKNGQKHGDFISRDSLGNILEKGNFKHNKKAGSWVNTKTKDTVFYKKGAVLVPETNDKKEGFFKRLFKKKENSKAKTSKKGKTTKAKTTKKKDPKKDGFFKRLFKKKDKKATKAKN